MLATLTCNSQSVKVMKGGKLIAEFFERDGLKFVYDKNEPEIVPEYVDLGLSVMWATCNVGATKPEEYGDYFAWGETEPYYAKGHSQDSPCKNWRTGKDEGYIFRSYFDFNSEKYATNLKNVLDLEDDAAYVNKGATWRIPTDAELTELREQCTWTWTTSNGVNGYLVTSKVNDNSIFLPAAGIRSDKSLDYSGSHARYWSSTLSTDDYAYYVTFYPEDVRRDYYNRFEGYSVRPVLIEGENPALSGTCNEHGYVDLGLPSGIKWATMNIGATTPEGYGDYFAWGETTAFGRDLSDGRVFDMESYRWYNGLNDKLTKYCTSEEYGFVDNRTVLEPGDDAATVNWGGDWRMPTREEANELIANCSWTWTKRNGVTGYVGKSNANGKLIFLPAAGNRNHSNLLNFGVWGNYATSSLHWEENDWDFDFSGSNSVMSLESGDISVYSSDRFNGQSVRAVCP